MAGLGVPAPAQRLCQPPCASQCAGWAPPRRLHRMPWPEAMPAQQESVFWACHITRNKRACPRGEKRDDLRCAPCKLHFKSSSGEGQASEAEEGKAAPGPRARPSARHLNPRCPELLSAALRGHTLTWG